MFRAAVIVFLVPVSWWLGNESLGSNSITTFDGTIRKSSCCNGLVINQPQGSVYSSNGTCSTRVGNLTSHVLQVLFHTASIQKQCTYFVDCRQLWRWCQASCLGFDQHLPVQTRRRKSQEQHCFLSPTWFYDSSISLLIVNWTQSYKGKPHAQLRDGRTWLTPTLQIILSSPTCIHWCQKSQTK